MKLTNPIKVTKPDPDSTNPALATGGMTAVVALVVYLVARQLDMNPEVLAGLAVILAPVVTAAITRLRVYSPATVTKLLAARGDDRELLP